MAIQEDKKVKRMFKLSIKTSKYSGWFILTDNWFGWRNTYGMSQVNLWVCPGENLEVGLAKTNNLLNMKSITQ